MYQPFGLVQIFRTNILPYYMETFGERLKQRRKERVFSQEDLAERLGKSGKTVISSWETGKAEPSLSDLRKLSEALQTTSCWLVDGIEAGKSPVLREAPEGYSLISNTELIELQRKALRSQE